MESIEQQKTIPSSLNLMRMKLVLENDNGEPKDARIVNIDSSVAQFSDIKTRVELSFPELDKTDYVLGWINEEEDFITMGSDEELKAALAEVKGSMLDIHVKQKQNIKNKDRKCPKIQLPRQYFANLLAARQNISGPGALVLHNQSIEKIRKVIRKHPGILFIGGDIDVEIGKMAENNGQIVKRQNIKEKKEFNNSSQLIVKRIIPPQKAIALLKNTEDENKETSTKLSILFLPTIAGRKKQHCHVFGTWEDSKITCVAFKRRGTGGQEPGTNGVKQGKMGKGQKGKNRSGMMKSEKKRKEDDEQECVDQRQMMMNQNRRKSGVKMKKGKETKNSTNSSGAPPNQCLVPRKRMKMIANRIFMKICVNKASENV